MSLITTAEYKTLVGIDPTDTRKDSQIDALIPAVDRLVKAFTDRDFTVSTGTATPKTFQYDGSGYLDIDDCTNVTALSTDAGVVGQTYALNTDEWTAMPYGGEIIYYIVIYGGPFGGISPEMGFLRNLDTYERPVPGRFSLMTVTATWGWPAIPSDVKLAAAWTIQDTLARPQGDALTSQSIESFSQSWARGSMGALASLALPNRARDILVNYQRQEV